MSDRWNSPPELTKEMREAAYISYCNASAKQGYIAFQNIVDCFRAAFDAKRRTENKSSDIT